MTVKRRNFGRNHAYYDVLPDGGERKFDGVTTLIGGGIPKPALVRWSSRTVAEFVAELLRDVDGHLLADDMLPALHKINQAARYPEKWDGRTFSRLAIAKILTGLPYAERDAAANRGTEVHALAARLIAGEEVDVPDELAGHVESYVRFLDEWDPQESTTEVVVANRQWNYAGQFDLAATFPPPYGRCLADIKTSRSGIYPETALQLSGYAHAEVHLGEDGTEHPMADLGITRGLGIWVRADGYDVYPVDITDRTFKDFLHAAWIARWFDRNDGLIGPALRVPVVAAQAAS